MARYLILGLVVVVVFVGATTAAKRTPKPISQHQPTIFQDLPRLADLRIYIRVLENILEFCYRHQNEIDLNFNFGLFLINVNLKYVMEEKQAVLPKHLHRRLKQLVLKNDKMMKHFRTMAKKDRDPMNVKNKLIYTLFMNESDWLNRIIRFNVDITRLSPRNAQAQLERKQSTWRTYVMKIDDVEGGKPSPGESDVCMSSLARNPVHLTDEVQICKVNKSCYDMLLFGSDFGYALSHRILLLLMARFGRGCVLFSPQIDKELSRRFCTSAYAEAEYIALNNYRIPDLMLEQITLCTLDDHMQFIRRSWIKNLLKLQTAEGCFGRGKVEKIKKKVNVPLKTWKFIRSRNHKLEKNCIIGFTSGAASALSGAIRYLLLTFY